MIRTTFGRLAAALFAALAIAGAFAVLAAPAKADAASDAAIKAAPKYSGKVTAVDPKAMTISIHSKKDGDMTFTVPTTAVVKVNKAVSTLASVVVGQIATIHSSDGKAALAVSAHDKTAPGAAPNGSASPGTSPPSGTQ